MWGWWWHVCVVRTTLAAMWIVDGGIEREDGGHEGDRRTPGLPLTQPPPPGSASVLAAHTPPARRRRSQRPSLSSPPGACARVCEKAMEPAMEPALEPPRAAEGTLPEAGRREGRGERAPPGPLLWGCAAASGMAGVPVAPLRGCGQVGFGSFPRARASPPLPLRPQLPSVLEASVRAGSGGRLAPVTRGETR